jgi:hypothetical protein
VLCQRGEALGLQAEEAVHFAGKVNAKLHTEDASCAADLEADIA